MKPLDFGGGGINGSLDANGRIIALNFYHPEYGYVTLTSADPFPDDKRYDQAAVRAYRKSLTTLEGFGFAGEKQPRVQTQVVNGCVVQTCRVEPDVILRFRGRFSLQRCAYTQLTEGGPIPAPPIHTHLMTHFGALEVNNPAVGWIVIGGLAIENPPTNIEADGAVEFDFAVRQENNQARIAYAFGLNRMEAYQKLSTLPIQFYPSDPLVKRGIEYSFNMAVPVNEGVCLLTDHMLLPLSWNRDAYYAARALLSWHADFHDTVRRHLIWMFEIAERIDGAWARCYLANGKVKDDAFQLDQQLFPLLELAEYTLETGDRTTFERLQPHAQAILDMLLARKADFAALFPTDETPGDDPIALPYHLSSHILFWKVLDKLKRLGFDTGTLADDIRAVVDRCFVTEHDGKRLYAYATDGTGRCHLYHDANDFPTVLAPIWGWCSADDPVWQATIDFAFSEANKDGFYQGHVGSVHTRAPWPLGDVQDLIVGQITGDQARIDRARAALRFATQPDGALPEAYDAETGEVVSRHWFAWPNAAYACVELGAFRP